MRRKKLKIEPMSSSVRFDEGMISYLKKFTFLLFLLAVITPAYAQSFEWERTVEKKARKLDGDFDYIGLQQLADILKTNTYYSDKARKAVLYIGNEKLTVTAFNPFVLIGKNVFQMPIDCRYEDDDIWVPTKFFLPILKDVIARNGTNGLDIETNQINITGVRVEEKANGTLIRLNTLADFNKANISTRYSRNWLHLDILNGQLNPTTFVVENDKKLVKEIVAEQIGELAHVAFHLKRDMAGTKFDFTQHSNSIWLSIPSKNNKDVVKNLEHEKEKWRIDKIVIDPGHGGKDPGTIGTRGTYEKDIVLAISKKLKRLLQEKLNIQVFMTRDTDEYISLKDRTQFANQVGGKLFISIHANWNRNRSVRGASTYFLGLAKSDEALEIAQRENAVIRYEEESDYAELTDEKIILAAMAQNSYNKESQDLAAIIQDSIHEHTGIKDRGVRQAGFYVLVGASMPNVLVETAFMSNKHEERLLRSSDFQQKIAYSIYESINEFKQRYELTMK